jgi:hypothetical protein
MDGKGDADGLYMYPQPPNSTAHLLVEAKARVMDGWWIDNVKVNALPTLSNEKGQIGLRLNYY